MQRISLRPFHFSHYTWREEEQIYGKLQGCFATTAIAGSPTRAKPSYVAKELILLRQSTFVLTEARGRSASLNTGHLAAGFSI
jgi:hypothetical protein